MPGGTLGAQEEQREASSGEPRGDPLGRDTPRGTVEGYLRAMDEGDLERAAEYLDLRYLPREVAQYSGEQIAWGLSLVLERGLWIDVENLSDDPAGFANDGLPPYRDALGEIDTRDGSVTLLLQRVPADDGGSIWKFSNATIAELPELYQLYRYNRYVEWLAQTLPEVKFLGLQLFKWVAALTMTAAVAPVVLALMWLVARLFRKPGHALYAKTRRFFMLPVSVLILLAIFDAIVTDLGLGAQAREIARGQTLSILVTLWVIWSGLNLIRDWYFLRLEKLGRAASIPLVRPLTTALKFVFILLGFLVWLDNIGYEITALLAGLGIGGVAVALVLQKPLEDVLGALSLYTQQPVRIGDFGRFGGYAGTIEEISLRTTRIRTLENSVVAVPNMRMASEPIENLSARTRILYQPVLRIRHDTPPDRVEQLLDSVRELLAGDERVLEGARVRFTGIGPAGFEIQVFAYVDTTEWAAYLGVAEELNLAILGRLREAGVTLARPLDDALAERGD